MKTLLLIAFLFVTITAFSQNHPFIRVFTTTYNDKHEIVIRGNLTAISDSSVTVDGKLISYHNITLVKTKRSFGHSLWTYSLGGLTFGVAVGVVAEKSKKMTTNNNENISSFCSCVSHDGIYPAVGASIGSILGIATGATLGVTKKRTTILVYNDLKQWQIAKAILQEKMKK